MPNIINFDPECGSIWLWVRPGLWRSTKRTSVRAG